MTTSCRLNPLWQSTWLNLNEAYDPLVFPERFRQAERNAQNVLNGRWQGPPFTAHLLDRFLPVDEDNPRHPCKQRYQRTQVSYSRRCRPNCCSIAYDPCRSYPPCCDKSH